MKCPECGEEFEEYKGNCRGCGFPLSVIPKILEARRKGVKSSPYRKGG